MKNNIAKTRTGIMFSIITDYPHVKEDMIIRTPIYRLNKNHSLFKQLGMDDEYEILSMYTVEDFNAGIVNFQELIGYITTNFNTIYEKGRTFLSGIDIAKIAFGVGNELEIKTIDISDDFIYFQPEDHDDLDEYERENDGNCFGKIYSPRPGIFLFKYEYEDMYVNTVFVNKNLLGIEYFKLDDTKDAHLLSPSFDGISDSDWEKIDNEEVFIPNIYSEIDIQSIAKYII